MNPQMTGRFILVATVPETVSGTEYEARIYGRGTTVPTDATVGWAAGAFFLKTDGSTGTTLYVNEGDASTSDFNPSNDAAGVTAEIAAAVADYLPLAGGSISGALAIVGALTKNGIIQPDGCTFIVGAAHATAVNVAGVIKAGGTALAHSVVVDAYLSDSPTGLGITTATPDGTVAIVTDGEILASVTAKIYLKVETAADGKFDITVTHSGGADDWYLVVIINGVKFVSGKIEIT